MTKDEFEQAIYELRIGYERDKLAFLRECMHRITDRMWRYEQDLTKLQQEFEKEYGTQSQPS